MGQWGTSLEIGRQENNREGAVGKKYSDWWARKQSRWGSGHLGTSIEIGGEQNNREATEIEQTQEQPLGDSWDEKLSESLIVDIQDIFPHLWDGKQMLSITCANLNKHEQKLIRPRKKTIWN